jgi:hypothetical protein
MLSKSRYLAGLQCPLRLWYQSYNRDLASKVSPVQQALFDTGHEVGELATRLYPEGVLIEEDHLHHKEAVQTTLDVMDDASVGAIFEAAFLYDGIRVRVDILERLKNDRWNLIEVKSSTSVKEVYLPDVAIQYHVLRGARLDIDQVFLMYVNNQYVYDGNRLELERFFSSSDLKDQALSYQEELPLRLAALKDMLKKTNAPEVLPSRHCHNPYTCEFWEHCTKEMPANWVMKLAGITQKRLIELAAMDINDISDVPGSFPLTMLQERTKRCVINNEEYISQELEDELKAVAYPIHFLDFETMGPAIPRYTGTRPYQTVPFQWSDHILSTDGTLEHQEYLCDEDKDPREEFTLTLLEALGSEGTIVIYTTYEEGVIRELAEYLPRYRGPLFRILDRFKDLHALIKKHYYHPAFQGSFSLKAVLPALLPAMGYENLAIEEGSQASIEYLRMIDPATPSAEKARIKADLLTYCAHDTLAMLKIREDLLNRFH